MTALDQANDKQTAHVETLTATPKYDSSVKRCDVEGHVYGRGKCEGFEASPATIELIRKEVARQAEEISRRRRLIAAAEDAPLIVLAGLR